MNFKFLQAKVVGNLLRSIKNNFYLYKNQTYRIDFTLDEILVFNQENDLLEISKEICFEALKLFGDHNQ